MFVIGKQIVYLHAAANWGSRISTLISKLVVFFSSIINIAKTIWNHLNLSSNQYVFNHYIPAAKW